MGAEDMQKKGLQDKPLFCVIKMVQNCGKAHIAFADSLVVTAAEQDQDPENIVAAAIIAAAATAIAAAKAAKTISIAAQTQ